MTVIRDLKAFFFFFDWLKDVYENLKHEIEFIIKSSEFLAENKIKNTIKQYCPNISVEKIFNVLDLAQRLNLRSLNKHVALQNLSIHNM